MQEFKGSVVEHSAHEHWPGFNAQEGMKNQREWEGERQGVQLRITGCAYWSHFHNLPSETLLTLGNMLAEALVKIPGQPLPRTPLNLVYLIIPCHETEVT